MEMSLCTTRMLCHSHSEGRSVLSSRPRTRIAPLCIGKLRAQTAGRNGRATFARRSRSDGSTRRSRAGTTRMQAAPGPANSLAPVLVFDIETVPDVAGLRKLHGLGAELSDTAVATMAFQLSPPATGHASLPLHLHRVVALSCALSDRDTFRVWSLGENGDGEREIIQ